MAAQPHPVAAANVPSYIPIPGAAIPIHVPRDPTPTRGTGPPAAGGVGSGADAAGTSPTDPSKAAPFPPAMAAAAAASQNSSRSRFPTIPTTNLSSNVSDLVLSSLLPANLPKLAGQGATPAPGRTRELTSQHEGLGLNVMSNNFRRFVTKVGPIFWLQDRVEEILFWQKPVWTWAYIFLWSFICFNPRTLLFLPAAAVLAIFITLQEQKRPVPSLIGITQVAPAAGSTRRGGGDSPSYSASTAPDADGVPVVPPREAESTVDYYMNMQALQNLMGMIADIFELATPYLALIGGKDTSPTSFPVTPTLVVLVLLPPAILLPLTPPWAIPYLLLPAGLAPPLFFHPNLHPLFLSLPKSRHAREARAALEDMVLTDGLSDEIGSRPIARVEVWENERLDPAVAAKALVPNQPAPSLPPGSWSARFLRAGERGAWVKVRAPGNLWADEEPKSADADDGRMVLALKHKWTFVPDEDWRVDVPALWSEVGADTEGWAYADDSWTAPSDQPVDENPPAPSPPARRVTRRRRWWRRVYLEHGQTV